MNIPGINVNNGLQNGKNMPQNTCSDSAMDKAEIMKRIQALAFAKAETELYLDGHPDAAPAIMYYKEVVKKLLLETEKYEAKYGPITAMGNSGDSWDWVKGPWPWQYEGEVL